MAVNVILAAVAALGVLGVVLALLSPPKVQLQDRQYVQQELSFMEQIALKIEQAGIEATPQEVIRTSAFLAVLGAVLGILSTGSAVGVVIGGFIGAYGYWLYLNDRRDKRRLEYQAALGDVAALLIEGFKEGGTVQAALGKVVEYGPEIVREDFAAVAARLQGGMSLTEALKPLLELRRDPILDAIAQMLVVRVERGGQASEALAGLLDLVRERIQFRERVKAELGQPMWEVRLIGALPFLVVLFLRLTTPEYARFWKTGLGQISLVVSWGLVGVGYWVAMRYITKAMAIDESLGVVETKSKVAERPAGLPATEGEV